MKEYSPQNSKIKVKLVRKTQYPNICGSETREIRKFSNCEKSIYFIYFILYFYFVLGLLYFGNIYFTLSDTGENMELLAMDS
jgi:hypothetical protein